jgi:TPR repeat protein
LCLLKATPKAWVMRSRLNNATLSVFLFFGLAIGIGLTNKAFSAKSPTTLTPAQTIKAQLATEQQLYESQQYYQQGALAKSAKAIYALALAGNPKAQRLMGQYLRLGVGGVTNPTYAKYWYASSAPSEAVAAFNLGLCYKLGYGGVTDATQAVHYFKQAAKLGLPQAQQNVATAALTGEGTLPSLPLAIAQWEQLANHPTYGGKAKANLGHAYWVSLDSHHKPTQAILLLTQAAQQGFSLAQYHLGLIYLKVGYPKVGKTNPTLGLHWLQAAAKNGHTQAKQHLAGKAKGKPVLAEDYYLPLITQWDNTLF